MDFWIIAQVIILFIFSKESKKDKPNRQWALLLLAAWVAPIFFLGFIGAVIAWLASWIIFALIGTFLEWISPSQDAQKRKMESDSPQKDNHADQSDAKIIRCPCCKRKIRVKVPLRSDNGKCVACSCDFQLKIDDNGNIKAETIRKEKYDSNKGQSTTAIADHFKNIGVDPSASPDEVRAAYKRKIREYHPDKVVGLGDKIKNLAEEESKAINASYEFLKSRGLAR